MALETDERDAAAGSDLGTPAGPDTGSAGHRLRTAVFGGMLLLALVGMALNLSREDGPWEFWGVLLLAYAGVSIAWDWQRSRQHAEPVVRSLRRQLLHWGAVLVGLLVLLLFDRTDVLSRQATATVALLLLGTGCLLAGVHFDWTFLLLGGVLVGMTIAIAYLEHYLVWLVMVPVLVAVGWGYLRMRAGRDSSP